MATTDFTNGVTLTDDDWFDDVDFLVYDIFGDSTTTASAAARLAPSFNNLTVAGTLSISAGVAGAAVATQAQMEAGTSTTTIVTPGRAHFNPGSAKAWARFDGGATSVTAAASYNVASIADLGTGVYRITYTTAFSSDTAYAVVGTSNNSQLALRSVSAGSVSIVCSASDGTLQDGDIVCVVAFGDFA
jgi:hypothetical protein